MKRFGNLYSKIYDIDKSAKNCDCVTSVAYRLRRIRREKPQAQKRHHYQKAYYYAVKTLVSTVFKRKMHFLHIVVAMPGIRVGALRGNMPKSRVVEISGIERGIEHCSVIVDVVGGRLVRQRRALLVAYIYQFEIAYISVKIMFSGLSCGCTICWLWIYSRALTS